MYQCTEPDTNLQNESREDLSQPVSCSNLGDLPCTQRDEHSDYTDNQPSLPSEPAQNEVLNLEPKKGKRKPEIVRKVVKSATNHVDEIVNFIASQPSTNTSVEPETALKVEETEVDKLDHQEEIDLHRKVEEENETDKVMNVFDDMFDSTESSSEDSSDYEPNASEEKLDGSSRKKRTRSRGPYKCKDCQTSDEFILKNDYNQHLLTVHDIKVRVYQPPKKKREHHTFTCDVCSLVYTVKSEFIKHVKESHGLEKAFKCPECVARFTGPRNMQGHYYKFHDPEGKKFACTTCPKVFYVKSRLNRHMRSHLPKEGIVNTYCSMCEIDYSSKHALSQHMALTHDAKKKLFVCEHCGKTYANLKELNNHVNRHTLENLFMCTQCGQQYLSSDELKVHERRVHSGLEYKCELCSRKLSSLKSLKSHVRTIHLKEPSPRIRRYQCSECGLMCQSPAQRERHVRQVHLKEKPFECRLCDKRFGLQKLLNRHLDVHYEVKPFPCPHCEKSFSQKSNMEMHARTHTGEKPYVCKICDKGFTQSSNLKTHLKNHSGCHEFIQMAAEEISNSASEMHGESSDAVSTAFKESEKSSPADLVLGVEGWQELSHLLEPNILLQKED